MTPVTFRKIIGNRIGIDWRSGIPLVKSIFTHPGILGWFRVFNSLIYLFSILYVVKKFI